MHDTCTNDIQAEDKLVPQKFSFFLEYLRADSLGVLQQCGRQCVLGAVGTVHGTL